MKAVAFSDIHNYHKQVKLPPGDMMIAGEVELYIFEQLYKAYKKFQE